MRTSRAETSDASYERSYAAKRHPRGIFQVRLECEPPWPSVETSDSTLLALQLIRMEHVTKKLALAAIALMMLLVVPTLAMAAPLISSISSPVVVGDSFTISGSGFTNGSVINFFVATASGTVNFGPLTPATPITSSELTVPVPTSVSGKAIFLGEGVVGVQVVNEDQDFAASNVVTAQVFGDNAAGFPNLTAINGTGLASTSANPDVAVDNVETFVSPGTTITLSGNGFDTVNGAAVDLFCDCPGG